MSIITGDEKALTSAPGIGKKNRPARDPGVEGQAGEGGKLRRQGGS